MQPDGSTVVLFKDDTKKEVFLVFRSDYPIWGTTGGAIEKNETPEEAALREAYEETGFKTKIIKYCGTYQLTHNKLHLYEGRIISGKFKPEFPGCKGKWFKVNRLPKDMVTRTRREIIDAAHHQGKPFSKKGPMVNLKNDYPLALRHPLAFLKFFYNKFKNSL
jgi:8-oxo-dGTP pyrophosphatase MutT (NUDIX family)